MCEEFRVSGMRLWVRIAEESESERFQVLGVVKNIFILAACNNEGKEGKGQRVLTQGVLGKTVGKGFWVRYLKWRFPFSEATTR